jgi:nucleolin
MGRPSLGSLGPRSIYLLIF